MIFTALYLKKPIVESQLFLTVVSPSVYYLHDLSFVFAREISFKRKKVMKKDKKNVNVMKTKLQIDADLVGKVFPLKWIHFERVFHSTAKVNKIDFYGDLFT